MEKCPYCPHSKQSGRVQAASLCTVKLTTLREGAVPIPSRRTTPDDPEWPPPENPALDGVFFIVFNQKARGTVAVFCRFNATARISFAKNKGTSASPLCFYADGKIRLS
jgi:hypothetical protein